MAEAESYRIISSEPHGYLGKSKPAGGDGADVVPLYLSR